MKKYGGVKMYFYPLLTSEVDGDQWSTSPSGRFTPEETIPGTLCINS
jgi:hypothetical protein